MKYDFSKMTLNEKLLTSMVFHNREEVGEILTPKEELYWLMLTDAIENEMSKENQ